MAVSAGIRLEARYPNDAEAVVACCSFPLVEADQIGYVQNIPMDSWRH